MRSSSKKEEGVDVGVGVVGAETAAMLGVEGLHSLVPQLGLVVLLVMRGQKTGRQPWRPGV